jgi:hypothetical protein
MNGDIIDIGLATGLDYSDPRPIRITSSSR